MNDFFCNKFPERQHSPASEKKIFQLKSPLPPQLGSMQGLNRPCCIWEAPLESNIRKIQSASASALQVFLGRVMTEE
jgi:hypothetical protein